MRRFPIRAVYTSPLERAVETAEAIARKHSLKPEQVEEIGEIRIGEFEGMTLEELERREDWKRFCAFRGGMRAPGGEMMVETQARMVAAVERFRGRHPDDTVALVSHGDPLRSLVAYFLGMPLEYYSRFVLEPASLSIAQVADWGTRVWQVNGTGDEMP